MLSRPSCAKARFQMLSEGGTGSGSNTEGAGKGKGGATGALVFVGLVVIGYVAYQQIQSRQNSADGLDPSASGETIELAMWDQEEARNTVHIDRWIQEFQKDNPDIRITRQTLLNEELRTRYTTFATGGQAPEIVWGPNDNAGVFATAKLIADSAEFVDQSRFTQAALDCARIGGRVMGVPVSYGNHLMLFYNKKLVQEPPATTDDLIATAARFSDPAKNTYGLVFNLIEPFWIAPMLGGFGGWPLNYGADGSPQITLDSPAMVKTLSFLKDLKFKDRVVPAECDYDCAKGLFLEGKAPLTINGDWVVPEFIEGLGKENLGIAPLPVVSATGLPMTPMVSGRYLFLSAAMSPAKKAAVKKFVDHITGPKVQIEVATAMNRIPATVEAIESPLVQQLSDLKPLIDSAAHGRAMPPEAEMRTAWDSMRPGLQKVMAGSLEPAEAARLMQQSALDQLAAMKK